jgi:hypothetical protein
MNQHTNTNRNATNPHTWTKEIARLPVGGNNIKTHESAAQSHPPPKHPGQHHDLQMELRQEKRASGIDDAMKFIYALKKEQVEVEVNEVEQVGNGKGKGRRFGGR